MTIAYAIIAVDISDNELDRADGNLEEAIQGILDAGDEAPAAANVLAASSLEPDKVPSHRETWPQEWRFVEKKQY